MVRKKRKYMRIIECDVTPGRRAEINSGKSAYAYRRRNHCIEQLDVLLCRKNACVTKEDKDIIMNALQNKKTFTIHLDSQPKIHYNF